jgi:hypothetical protein
MQIPHRWRTAAMVAGALVIGSIVGPPLAQAAATATGLVRIQGGGSTAVAKVSKSGQLSVSTGLATTPTGQLQIAEASPKSVVSIYGQPSCGVGGIYTAPAGQALVITSINFYNWTVSPGAHQLVLYEGTNVKPCGDIGSTGIVSASVSDYDSSQNQVFPSGIIVPPGDTLGLYNFNDQGDVEIYGYLIPASAA